MIVDDDVIDKAKVNDLLQKVSFSGSYDDRALCSFGTGERVGHTERRNLQLNTTHRGIALWTIVG